MAHITSRTGAHIRLRGSPDYRATANPSRGDGGFRPPSGASCKRGRASMTIRKPLEHSELVTGKRIESLDVMRGVIMILMTLEHVRISSAWQAHLLWGAHSPLGPVDTTYSFPNVSALFFYIRWFSNFCAPIFIFLAGASVFLWHNRKGEAASLTRYLVTRGAWLVLVNFLIKTSAPFSGNPLFDLDVLWPIGVSMILLGLTLKLPKPLLWCLGLAVVFGHDLLDGVTVAGSPWRELWSVGFRAGEFPLPWGGSVYVRYPFVAWYGVMLIGYLLGPVFLAKERRLQRLCGIGAAMLAAFLLLRLTQGYGEPRLWQIYAETWKTAASFLNTSKYPPSLQFLLFNVGCMFLGIALIERFRLRSGLLLAIGSCPLFFYVAHYLMTRAGAKALAVYNGPGADALRAALFSPPGIAIVALCVVLVLYPACIRLQKHKSAKRTTARARYEEAFLK